MFGAFGAARAMQQRQIAKDAPKRDVTWKQFLLAAGIAGMKEPEFHGRVAHGMGSHVLAGGMLLRIKGRIPKVDK